MDQPPRAAKANQGPVTAIDAIRAIVSDLDNTLLGDEEALERFAAWHALEGSEIRLIYASGRFFGSVLETIETTALPEPEFIIGGVGTEVRSFPSGRLDGAWPDLFKNRFDASTVIDALRGFPGLEQQPECFLSEFKVSYYLHDAGPSELHAVRSLLLEASIDAELVYSSNRDLDVLPAGVNKGSAARHVIENLGIQRDHVIACGDSANDLSMFRHGFRGIVVGNAHEELRSLSDSNVHQAKQNYAAGVLEGLERWGAMATANERGLVGAS